MTGRLDFRKARWEDPAWMRYYNSVMALLEKETLQEATAAAYPFHLLLSHLKKDFQPAQEGYFDLIGYLRPWEGESFKARKRNELRDSRELYKATFGVDPASPEFKAFEAVQIRRWLAGEFNKVDAAADNEHKILQQRRNWKGKPQRRQ